MLEATSLPQPLTGLPKGCLPAPASSFQHDLADRRVNRDSGAGITARSQTNRHPCGVLAAGGQTNTFEFFNRWKVKLVWSLGATAIATSQVVRLVRVIPGGQDEIGAMALASARVIAHFRPLLDFEHYLTLSGPPFDRSI